jgi:hypothetical protein
VIHFVHNRPTNILKVFGPASGQAQTFEAGSDAWGNYGVSQDKLPPVPPWGHSCRIPPGHYVLGNPEIYPVPLSGEGAGQISILDIGGVTLATLVGANLATKTNTGGTPGAIIGQIDLPLGQLMAWGNREALLIHGGGTNLKSHFNDPNQRLLRTYGCVRVHNKDLITLIGFVKQNLAGQTIVYSAYGVPAPLPGF